MAADHHGRGPVDLEEAERLRKAHEERVKALTPHVQLGRAHEHPSGHYGPHDEGATTLAFGHDRDNRKVWLEFGTPVTWLALSPEQALQWARQLAEHAACAVGATPAKKVRTEGELRRAVRKAIAEGRR